MSTRASLRKTLRMRSSNISLFHSDPLTSQTSINQPLPQEWSHGIF